MFLGKWREVFDASPGAANLLAAGSRPGWRQWGAMAKILKWLGAGLAAALVVLVALALALQHWLRTDDFRARAERQASAALGVPVQLGRLSVDLWPLPAVAAERVRVATRPALTLGRIEARPAWGPLLAGRLEVATLVVRQAVLPQAAIGAIGAAMQKKERAAARPGTAPAPAAAVPWPRSVVLDAITWVDEKGQRTTVDARLDLGGDGLLDEATVQVLRGRFVGAKGRIAREADHWPVRLEIGGGKVVGRLQLQPGARAGVQLLQGQLATENVEVAALTAPSKPLTGKLQAQTTLRAEYREIGQLADALRTQTRFTVRDAVVQGLDLAKAVETVGLSRGGITRLDTLAGQVQTQGQAVQLSNLVATSGKLAATGNVAIAADRKLSGRVVVDLDNRIGTAGVPLAVGGTLDAPSVNLTRGALLGAAVGTLVAPGVGTAGGAAAGERIGDALKGLFGK